MRRSTTQVALGAKAANKGKEEARKMVMNNYIASPEAKIMRESFEKKKQNTLTTSPPGRSSSKSSGQGAQIG